MPTLTWDNYGRQMHNVKEQARAGLGDLRDTVAEQLYQQHGSHLWDKEEFLRYLQCDKLADSFEPINLPHNPSYGLTFGDTFAPYFSSSGMSGRVTYGLTALWLEYTHMNACMAQHIGHQEFEADYTVNPPEWACVRLGECRSTLNLPNMLVIDPDDTVTKALPPIPYSKWNDVRHIYLWRAHLPVFPLTALELVNRCRTIAPDGRLFLIFKPEWHLEKVQLPAQDPYILCKFEVKRGYSGDEGALWHWFKVAQWGADQELVL